MAPTVGSGPPAPSSGPPGCAPPGSGPPGAGPPPPPVRQRSSKWIPDYHGPVLDRAK